MATLAEIIIRLRTRVKDTTTDNSKLAESLDGNPDGTNRQFKFSRGNLVKDETLKLYQDGSDYTWGNDEIDEVKGAVTFAIAPTNGKKITADYSFYHMSDTQATEFLNTAATLCASSVTDPILVATGLVPAMIMFAASFYYEFRAAEAAEMISASSGGVSVSPDNPSRMFSSLAKSLRDGAEKAVKAYYSGGDQEARPASAVGYPKPSRWQGRS